MDKSPNPNERLWLLPFIITPVILFTRLSTAFTDNSTYQLLAALVIGATSGLLGAGIYKLVRNKKILVKIIVLLIFVAAVIAAYLFISNYAETHYQNI